MKDETLNEFLLEGLDDWIPDYEAHGIVNNYYYTKHSHQATLDALEWLFSNHLFVPGYLEISGFIPWGGDTSDWMPKVAKDYEHFQWASHGAGFWLDLTGKGEALATERNVIGLAHQEL